MSQCRPHCLTDGWTLCFAGTEISPQTQKIYTYIYLLLKELCRDIASCYCSKTSAMVQGEDTARGSEAGEVMHKANNKLKFLCSLHFFESRELNRENGCSNYQRTQWDCFFMLVDILIWEKIMKAIRTSPRFSHWAHSLSLTCLLLTLKTSTSLFGVLSAFRLWHFLIKSSINSVWSVLFHISQNARLTMSPWDPVVSYWGLSCDVKGHFLFLCSFLGCIVEKNKAPSEPFHTKFIYFINSVTLEW